MPGALQPPGGGRRAGHHLRSGHCRSGLCARVGARRLRTRPRRSPRPIAAAAPSPWPAVARPALVAITLLIVAASFMNVVLQRRLQSGRTIYLGLALLAGVLDAAAISIAVALIDGFANETFVLYYPALLAFSLVFRGWWSLY